MAQGQRLKSKKFINWAVTWPYIEISYKKNSNPYSLGIAQFITQRLLTL